MDLTLIQHAHSQLHAKMILNVASKNFEVTILNYISWLNIP